MSRVEDRKRWLKRYGRFYSRMFFREDGLQVCVYCGNVAEQRDHVPPLSWVYSFGSEYFGRMLIPLVLVPACCECNGMLSDHKLFTLRDRRMYLLGRYQKKYERYLRGEIWEQEEIDELGRGLKQRVDGHRTCQIGFDRRIKIIEESLRDAGMRY